MYRRSTKQRVALAALVAASATFVTLDFRTNQGGTLRRIQEGALSLVAPLQDGITRVFRPVGDFLSSLGEIGGLRSENERLREEVESLESQLRRFPETERENQRLLALLEQKDWAVGPTVAARVIGVGPSNYEWTVFIDKGSRDGLTEKMAVVSSEGLVGRVELVGTDYAKVLLSIDPEHSAGARLTGSGETGVVTGRSREDLFLDLIDAETKIEEGETVVTSGYDRGVFPAGIPVGRVTSFRVSANGLEKTARVRPFVDFGRLDHVLILVDSGVKEGL